MAQSDKQKRKRDIRRRTKRTRTQQTAIAHRRVDQWKPTDHKPAPILLNSKLPMPPRNGPCPLHPAHKLKKCPHLCLENVFKVNRAREAGDAVLVHVAEADPRAGRRGAERTEVVQVLELNRLIDSYGADT